MILVFYLMVVVYNEHCFRGFDKYQKGPKCQIFEILEFCRWWKGWFWGLGLTLVRSKKIVIGISVKNVEQGAKKKILVLV